jgi:hypothetical protein
LVSFKPYLTRQIPQIAFGSGEFEKFFTPHFMLMVTKLRDCHLNSHQQGTVLLP